MTFENLIQQAANLIRNSRHLTVLTGAGVSAESGIPTFREALSGLWEEYDPARLATRQAFEDDPKLVWNFYEYRRSLVRPAQPNPAHQALAALERRYPSMHIITMNVDDLHERAGSHNVIHLHGLIEANRCSANCQGAPTPVDISQIEWDHASGPPPCPYCGKPVRPDVVWFGEVLPSDALGKAHDAAQQTDLMLVIGTSGVVRPASDLPALAKRHGTKIIEFNPVESEITPLADLWLPAPSGETLPRVLAALGDDA